MNKSQTPQGFAAIHPPRRVWPSQLLIIYDNLPAPKQSQAKQDNARSEQNSPESTDTDSPA